MYYRTDCIVSDNLWNFHEWDIQGNGRWIINSRTMLIDNLWFMEKDIEGSTKLRISFGCVVAPVHRQTCWHVRKIISLRTWCRDASASLDDYCDSVMAENAFSKALQKSNLYFSIIIIKKKFFFMNNLIEMQFYKLEI